MKSIIFFVFCIAGIRGYPQPDPALLYHSPLPLYYNYPASHPVSPYAYVPYQYAPLVYKKPATPVASVKTAQKNVDLNAEQVEGAVEGAKAPALPLNRAYYPFYNYNHYPYYYNSPYNVVAKHKSVLQTLN
uniref:Uncharacterized protein n=1 Tax=Lepeophtheirus salmonis TaxID=72036 RepID=A0A0K2TWQ1_LEPSM|nr:uncharacterized protein LOC121116270 [Lepeophtheirus salmonis]